MSRLKGIATLQKLLCAACALLLLLAPVSTAAQDAPSGASETSPDGAMDYDVFCIINDCAYYDPYSCGEEGATQLIGRDNIEKAYNFFISKGLEPHQSAGIVGNLMQESGVNPSSNNPAAQPPATPASTYFPGLTYNGGGIAQWEGERWSGENGLLAYAMERGTAWDDLATQLEFIWKEMPSQYASDNATLLSILPNARPPVSALDAVRLAEDYTQAAWAFELAFERAGNPVMDNRIKNAERVYAQYGAGGSGSPNPDDCHSGILVGNYAFPLAPQTKRPYGNLPLTNCTHYTNGPYTRNGIYTDENGVSTEVTTCHHDATPAFDLSYAGVADQPIYAITDGVVEFISVSRHPEMGGGTPCQNINLRATIEGDNTWYWYGHVLASVTDGQEVKAGDVIGRVSPQSYGPICWMGGVHLHIDRGCVTGSQPVSGGREICRDPAFTHDLQAIWEALPEE